jgi:hypothetical protein
VEWYPQYVSNGNDWTEETSEVLPRGQMERYPLNMINSLKCAHWRVLSFIGRTDCYNRESVVHDKHIEGKIQQL